MSTKVFLLFFIIIFSTKCDEDSALIQKLKSFLQNHVDNALLLKFFEFLRQLKQKEFPDHLAKNKAAFPNHLTTIKNNKGYIEDQRNYKDMFYGVSPFSDNGCELISIYNVLNYFGVQNIDLPGIIEKNEKDGMILSGAFGTSPIAIEDYFKTNGYKTMSSSQKKDYENIANSSDALILTMYNDIKDITAQIHTVAITKNKFKYYVHNNGANSASVGYTSITALLTKINSGKAKDIFLIGVSKK